MTKQERIAALVRETFAMSPPKTQYDVALLGARCSVALAAAPRNDAEFIDAAHGMASGLFGPAFVAADYGQKSTWIDMCERALREVVSAPMK